VVSLVTLPVVVDLAIGYFGAPFASIGAQPRTALELFAVVLVPVLVGMLMRARRPALAQRMDRARCRRAAGVQVAGKAFGRPRSRR
jgi:BASS family bile acid:Na+ symporter